MHLTFQPHFIYTHTSSRPATPLVHLPSNHLHPQLQNTSASISFLLLDSTHCHPHTWLPDKHLIIFQDSAQIATIPQSLLWWLSFIPWPPSYIAPITINFTFYVTFLFSQINCKHLRGKPHLIFCPITYHSVLCTLVLIKGLFNEE